MAPGAADHLAASKYSGSDIGNPAQSHLALKFRPVNAKSVLLQAPLPMLHQNSSLGSPVIKVQISTGVQNPPFPSFLLLIP